MLRVALLVDGLNMLKAAERVKRRINFGELARAVAALNGSRKREIVFQRFYIGPASEGGASDRIDRLREEVMAFGYEWIQCATDNAYARQKTTTVDTVISMDMLAWAYCHTVDVIALCSGDGGFAEAIRRIKVLGLRVEVYAVKLSNHVAAELRQQAHPIWDLGALGVLQQGDGYSTAHLLEAVCVSGCNADRQ